VQRSAAAATEILIDPRCAADPGPFRSVAVPAAVHHERAFAHAV